MELGSLEIQIFVSLMVILAAAFVALVCDFLKGNNEQLRERNLELRVRQEERERLGLSQPAQLMQGQGARARNSQLTEATAAGSPQTARVAPPPAAAPPANAIPAPVSASPAEPSGIATGTRSTGSSWRDEEDRAQPAGARLRPETWARREELEQLAERAARIRARHEASVRKADAEARREPVGPETVVQPPGTQEQQPARPAEAKPQGPTTQPDPLRAKVLSIDKAHERLETREALDLNAQLDRVDAIAPGPQPSAEPSLAEAAPASPPLPAAREPAPVEAATAEPDRVADEVETTEPAIGEDAAPPVPAAQDEAEPVADPFPVQENDADTSPQASVAAHTVDESVAGPAAAAHTETGKVPAVCELAVPAGMHDAPVLSTLLESTATFTGVVVAIGINDYEAVRKKQMSSSGADSLESLDRMILSMLRSNDFACRCREDEFLLLFPSVTGASAQRCLFQVSQKLWDYQLCSLGHLSVMFSWGGFEVSREPLREAVTSARERMFQTKRTRRPAPFDQVPPTRRAVNG